jgi:aldehyde:ferredoxin oxidoreductase
VLESQFSGYWGSILRIDLTNRATRPEALSEAFFRRYAGGGLLATEILRSSTPAGLDALDPANLLIFSNSVCSGLPGAGLDRFTVVAKSPMTNGIGESRCEGPWSAALKCSGADALIVQGRAERLCVLLIEDGVVSFLDGESLCGLDVGETCDSLEQQLGSGIHVAAIGPAGERLVRYASVVTDRSYQAARMGMGAVMGSKNLKAVVLRGGTRPAAADQSCLNRLTESFARRIAGNPLSACQRDAPGFSCWVHLHGLDAALCVNNYSQPTLSGTERFTKEQFMMRHQGTAGCPTCPNECIQFLHPLAQATDLDPRASGIHQEAPGTLGPNLGITDLDWVLRASNLCNQFGLDPTSLGFSLSFAMELREKGLLDETAPQFGDCAGAEKAMGRIVRREGLGNLLAEGTRRAAQSLGGNAGEFAMEVKGLEMTCFEPRSQTGLALGYATAPLGPRYDICEHDWDFDTTVGWSHSLDLARAVGIDTRIAMNELSVEKVRRFKALNTLWSAADTLDLCIFAIAPTRILSLPEMNQVLAAATGWKTSDYEVMRYGERRNHLMRLYNLREGIGADQDTLPARFFNESISTGPRKGDRLDRTEFQACIHSYYVMMGWDAGGAPVRETLIDHQLV